MPGDVFLSVCGSSSLVSGISSIGIGDLPCEYFSGRGDRDVGNGSSPVVPVSEVSSLGIADARSARRSSDKRLF